MWTYEKYLRDQVARDGWSVSEDRRLAADMLRRGADLCDQGLDEAALESARQAIRAIHGAQELLPRLNALSDVLTRFEAGDIHE